MKPHRVKLVFDESSYEECMKLAKKAGCLGLSDTFEKACAVLEYILDQQIAGNTIAIESPDGSRDTLEIWGNGDTPESMKKIVDADRDEG